jgi:hypothetical protein
MSLRHYVTTALWHHSDAMNGAVPTIKQPHRARRRRTLQHSFHVLTDGSEFTGNGCIFLTPTATSAIR